MRGREAEPNSVMPAEERLFAVRGAIQVEANEAAAIRAASAELVGELIARNDLQP